MGSVLQDSAVVNSRLSFVGLDPRRARRVGYGRAKFQKRDRTALPLVWSSHRYES